MKKTLYLVLILLLVASSSVFAAQYTGTTTTVIGGGIFAPSVGVTVEAASAPTSFCANAGHTNGKVQYNTCSGTGLGTINRRRFMHVKLKVLPALRRQPLRALAAAQAAGSKYFCHLRERDWRQFASPFFFPRALC